MGLRKECDFLPVLVFRPCGSFFGLCPCRSLGLGWRLARTAGAIGFRRWNRGAYYRRRGGNCDGSSARKSHGFPYPGNAATQYAGDHDRHGLGMLWVGWFGFFSGGSALAANGNAGMAILVTHISASAGALTWMFAGVGSVQASLALWALLLAWWLDSALLPLHPVMLVRRAL